LLVGIGFQYNQLQQTSNQVVNATTEKKKNGTRTEPTGA
jgi:hypothetical protein